ncbi:protein TE38 [Testudinid alphaherpesvirus 3]|uniref:Protein TE38 n=1 Tax=Testudinid alphaherpesvirus 3 TaxID=2560801 RepID=A0A0K1R184_9ALPH|nr:protein TE38 [Testudinid alphaherpesvirus 3]AIU39348.1 protein TE38 [Testudinid alphaherpesvirus 3]AIU39442.1 protein TE38 [Testudinid alphaherpesvirus 3]AKI81717.1 protein TE38 [Testudinid alphaherpesvirus 3]AKI81818.1 protein TE38 [Testudinid alphaherpesvirus 3]AKV40665.1 hypothetical protein [Testudinid alphaherpesvirus 3]
MTEMVSGMQSTSEQMCTLFSHELSHDGAVAIQNSARIILSMTKFIVPVCTAILQQTNCEGEYEDVATDQEIETAKNTACRLITQAMTENRPEDRLELQSLIEAYKLKITELKLRRTLSDT